MGEGYLDVLHWVALCLENIPEGSRPGFIVVAIPRRQEDAQRKLDGIGIRLMDIANGMRRGRLHGNSFDHIMRVEPETRRIQAIRVTTAEFFH